GRTAEPLRGMPSQLGRSVFASWILRERDLIGSGSIGIKRRGAHERFIGSQKIHECDEPDPDQEIPNQEVLPPRNPIEDGGRLLVKKQFQRYGSRTCQA